MNKPAPVAVKAVIFGKEFILSCPPEEEKALQRAIAMVNDRINDIKTAGKVVGTDSILLMAALNIAFELTQQSSTPPQDIDNNIARLEGLYQKIEAALKPSAYPDN